MTTLPTGLDRGLLENTGYCKQGMGSSGVANSTKEFFGRGTIRPQITTLSL